jgi:hypothetical protein
LDKRAIPTSTEAESACHDTGAHGKTQCRRVDGWLTDVPERIVAGHIKLNELHALLPWIWLLPSAHAII